MSEYKALSEAVLTWLQFPKLTIPESLWQELNELHGQLGENYETGMRGHDALLLDALDNFFTETGQGGVGRHSEGRKMDFSVFEIDCIPRMKEMVAAAPYFGDFSPDKVPIPSSHPARHASEALLLTYRKWLIAQD